MTRVVKTRGKICKEILQVLQDIRLIGMAKRLFKQPKVASRISSVVTLSTFAGLPVSVPLGTVTLAGMRVNGVATALTSKCQKKLTKVTKLVDIVLAVLEMSMSKALSNDEIDE